jgi:hypothetical protein
MVYSFFSSFSSRRFVRRDVVLVGGERFLLGATVLPPRPSAALTNEIDVRALVAEIAAKF